MDGVVFLYYRPPSIKSAVSLWLAFLNILRPDLIFTASFVREDSSVLN